MYGNTLTLSELGTSQGSVISPLLANIYLNTLDRLWEKYGLTHGTLVRYADDTVIICKNKKSANHALNLLQYIMEKLDLKLHPVKIKIVSMWDGKEGFDFLGMHHRRMTTETSKGQLYKETYQYPSRKAMKKMKAEIKRNINSRSLLVARKEDLIKNLNRKITGGRITIRPRQTQSRCKQQTGTLSAPLQGGITRNTKGEIVCQRWDLLEITFTKKG